MARKTIDALLSQATSTLADNVTEDISAADVRNMTLDFLDTMTPALGGLLQPSWTGSLTATPVPIVMASALAHASPEWIATLASATLARAVPVTAGAMTNQFWISGSVSGVNNCDVSVMLYKNGVAMPYQVVVTTRGAGLACTFSLGAVDAVVTADASYQLMTKASVAGSQTFANVLFIANNIPVRSLT